MKWLRKDTRGAVIAEFAVAMFPLFTTFFCFTQYAKAVSAKLMVKHAAVVACRAAIVISDENENNPGKHGPEGDIKASAAMAMLPYVKEGAISNIDVKIDGDRASVRAMFYNPMGMPSGKTFWCGGFYNHSLVRTADGWKSERLIEESSWFDRQSEAMG